MSIKFFEKPKVAFIIFTCWVILFLIIIAHLGGFSKKFLHFGPSTDPETQTEFLGSKVDTWEKVISIYILGFFSICFSTYYHNIFGSWMINSIKDHKETKLNMTKNTSYLLSNLDPVISTINNTLEFFVLLTLQLQFIIPQLLGEVFVTIFATRSFLSKKQKFSKSD